MSRVCPVILLPPASSSLLFVPGKAFWGFEKLSVRLRHSLVADQHAQTDSHAFASVTVQKDTEQLRRCYPKNEPSFPSSNAVAAMPHRAESSWQCRAGSLGVSGEAGGEGVWATGWLVQEISETLYELAR